MLVSGVQQNESVLRVHKTTLFFVRFFPLTGHCRILSRVPCAIQQILTSYLYYMESSVYVNPSLLISPSPIPSGKHKFVFHSCLVLLLFVVVVVVAAFFFFNFYWSIVSLQHSLAVQWLRLPLEMDESFISWLPTDHILNRPQNLLLVLFCSFKR